MLLINDDGKHFEENRELNCTCMFDFFPKISRFYMVLSTKHLTRSAFHKGVLEYNLTCLLTLS